MSEPINLTPIGESDLPIRSGPPPVELPPDPPEAVAALDQALALPDPGPALRTVAGRWPSFIDAWARLAEWALDRGLDVEGFAYSRTAYHRGLDRLRHNGWRGTG